MRHLLHFMYGIWYFKNRPLLINRITEHWQELATASIIAHIEMHHAVKPPEKIRQLLKLMFSSVDTKDFVYHLRKLGATESKYEDLLSTIEQQRLACGLRLQSGEGIIDLRFCVPLLFGLA
ncbi:hypothetical protein [Paenibacillus luteus]|uniref:hypothetical protein n=1 Tax=Paenibacillus luteus TaxID=2545753 RepID=UPI0019D50BF8|nr:hypothetical protein [Paenibacillus luteus]